MSSTRTATRKTAGKENRLAIGGVAIFAVLCCAALPIALTVGLGGMFSFLLSPLVLIPTALATMGIFAWHLKR